MFNFTTVEISLGEIQLNLNAIEKFLSRKIDSWDQNFPNRESKTNLTFWYQEAILITLVFANELAV